MKENIHEFEDAIIPHIGWIKNQVEEKGQIAMKLSDLANQLGPKFENKSEFILYLAMKYILYAEGIV